jgi:hypothetical protein
MLERRRTSVGVSRENVMGKIRQGNKEEKKPAVLTPKEKKAAKLAKKHASDAVPFITPR